MAGMKTMSLFVLTFLLLAACAAQTQTPNPTDTNGTTDSSKRITVTGTITDEGVECLALRGDDGKLYTLAGQKNAPPAGTRVRVTGTVAEISTCMQGTTIGVEKLERL